MNGPESSDDLTPSEKDIPMQEPKPLMVKGHRKNRRHQRVLKRKAYLQQRGLLGKRNVEADEDLCFVPNREHSCRLQSAVENLRDQSLKIAELKTMLHLLPAVASCPHSTACDDSGLSMSGSSQSSRPSSPVPLLKPGNCVAIDCEMVGTGPTRMGELARCSIVDYAGNLVYDKYIKPELPVTDYRTRWSGITPRHLKNAISFKKARKEILKILKGKLLIGHDLRHDFKVLKYHHNAQQIIDTSKTVLLRQMAGLPITRTPSLRNLVGCLLHKQIQAGTKGHSSVEDAQACMDLYKLVEDQLDQHSPHSLAGTTVSNSHYMDDQYWPSDLDEDCK